MELKLAYIYRIDNLLDVPEPCASDSFPSIICRAEKALENNILVVLRCARMEHAKEPIVAQVHEETLVDSTSHPQVRSRSVQTNLHSHVSRDWQYTRTWWALIELVLRLEST